MLDSTPFPKFVAVIGTSRFAGKAGHEILSNLVEGGYDGTLVRVNPRAGERLGLKC